MYYIITADPGENFTSPLFAELENNPQYTVLTQSQLAASDIRFTAADKIYVPYEGALEIVLQRDDDPARLAAISATKDKYEFRRLLAELYPHFYFKKVTLQALEDIELDFGKCEKYVVKPVRGFFGTGVREITCQNDLSKIKQEILAEITEASACFPESVISSTEVIIEQYIGESAEEFAIDAYYDEQGEPVIVAVYKHPVATDSAYSQVLYYTHEDIYEQYADLAKQFYRQLRQQLRVKGHELKSFPVHGEFKLEDQQLVPVEINPGRFGGFGLADLLYHALGVNPFTTFFENKIPNQQQLWQKQAGEYCAWVLAYNGKSVDRNSFQPNTQAFRSFLGDDKCLCVTPLDYRHNPAFAIAYCTDSELTNIERVLDLDFNVFFITIADPESSNVALEHSVKPKLQRDTVQPSQGKQLASTRHASDTFEIEQSRLRESLEALLGRFTSGNNCLKQGNDPTKSRVGMFPQAQPHTAELAVGYSK